MRAIRRTALAGALGWMILSPASACFTEARFDLRDVLTADVVVEGVVDQYELVVREQAPPYARFKIKVARTFVGPAAEHHTVTWSNSTFELPTKMDSRPRVFALRNPKNGAPMLPLRSASAVLWPTPEPDRLTVLQAPCSQAFIFRAREEWGRAIILIFEGGGDLKVKADAIIELRLKGRLSSIDDELRRTELQASQDREEAEIRRSLVLPAIRRGWAAEFLPSSP